MKKIKSLVSIFLVFVLIFGISGQSLVFAKDHGKKHRDEITLRFKDSDDAVWAQDYISKMISKNIFKGYGDGTFQPNKPITRVEAIVTAVRLMGLEDEAKEVSQDTRLYFRDAKQFESGQPYHWAKGYVVVALQNGLFDTSEDMIQPRKPATRVWVSSLLVRALGLQSEALNDMTATLDFKDAKSIPAGAWGYVKAAVDHELITGYPNGTFMPNKSVTRAEMAALLDRTSDGILEDSGAITVMGRVTDINFESTVTDQVYGEDSTVTEEVYGDDETVTDEVYGQADGEISIESFNGDSLNYSISSDLLVQDHDKFIKAKELLMDDLVSLVVKDNVVVEATLLDSNITDSQLTGIREFKVELEGQDNEYKLYYKNNDGRVRAEVKSESSDEEQRISGQEAENKIKGLLDQLQLTPDMEKGDIQEKIITSLELNVTDFNSIKIKISFYNGKRIEIESENEGEDSNSIEDTDKEENQDEEYSENNQNNEDEENAVIEDSSNVREFKLTIYSNHNQGSWYYEQDEDEVKAFVRDGDNKTSGKEAVNQLEQLFQDIALTDEMSNDEVVDAITSALEIDKNNVDSFKLEVKFSNHKKIEVDFGNRKHRDRDED